MNSLFANYLLVPILTTFSAVAVMIINKKQKVMAAKKLIILLLLTGIALGIPGLFGLMEQSYIPIGYLVAQFVYLFMGFLYLYFLRMYEKKALIEKKGFIFCATCVSMLAGIYVFKIVFDLLNPIGYNYLASSCIVPFIIPLLFYWAYTTLISVPAEVYKIWHFPLNAAPVDYDSLNFNNLMVLELEIYKRPDDNTPLKIKAKAPPDLDFGTWFRMFIEDYNEKFDTNGIRFLNDKEQPYGWMFYVQTGWLKKKTFIDPGVSISGNKIREEYTIVSKRVLEQTTANSVDAFAMRKMAPAY